MVNAVFVNVPKSAVVRQYNVGANNSISGGALLALTDPRTASGAYTTRIAAAGVAAAEKDYLNTEDVKIGIYEPGSGVIVDVEASGAVPLGGFVMLSGANKVSWLDADPFSGAHVLEMLRYKFGRSLETASNAEIFEVE